MATRPFVSVVIVVGELRDRAARTLASVLTQHGIKDQEIILVDAGSSDGGVIEGADHPSVKLLRPGGTLHFGELRAQAVRLARGEIVAFLEDHVWVHPGWLKAITESFSERRAAVGPEVHPGNPGLGVSDAVNLVGYGLWVPPLERGPSQLIPGNNSSYRRSVLLHYDGQLDALLLADTVLQMQLWSDGYQLYTEPEARISHLSPVSLRAGATAEFLYHQCFAAVRADVFAWPRMRRLEYVLRSALITWVRLARLGGFIFRHRPQLRALFVSLIAPTTVLLHAAVCGQAAGLLFTRRDDAAMRFTRFELNCPRPTASEIK